ncbi:hypothetical protein [Ochrobactrum sp. S1502_03]|uniref:hypothetical protein n=1 Tax=Ochrobactrum sp. S1502_03 TaxID=3108451 RepID=UPI0037C7E96F
MAKTTNYEWDLPSPKGLQLGEIAKIATTFTAIDVKIKSFETALSTHKHSFADLTHKPTTLGGFGITDGMTADEVAQAIKAAVDNLVNGSGEALDTLKELADALGNDPNFAASVGTALGVRVRVDAATNFSLAQRAQGRANIDALGTVDKGAAGGVASLDAGGKVPSAQLPALTTTATVGAAVAGANGKTTPADGDFFTGVEAGGSTMFKTTWANIRATLKAYFDTIYQKALGFTPVRQFNSGVVSVGWGSSGLELNVDATWFGNNWPISISGRANGGANWADGAAYANTLGNGGWSLDTIKDQLNWRLADARSAGWVEWDLNNNTVSNGVWLDSNGYYLTSFVKQKITTGGYTFPVVSRFAARQPQIYIPNVGWRALGGW